RGQMFWLDPASPNALAPRRRPRTTLSPTLVTREDGRAILAIGTPGGDQQDQWTFTALLRILHGVEDLQQALDTPMFHTNAFPSSFHPRETAPGDLAVAPGVGEETIRALRRRGHRVRVTGAWSLGRLATVARDPDSGELRAAAAARGSQGYAAGRWPVGSTPLAMPLARSSGHCVSRACGERPRANTRMSPPSELHTSRCRGRYCFPLPRWRPCSPPPCPRPALPSWPGL